jgi:hypothetical protein
MTPAAIELIRVFARDENQEVANEMLCRLERMGVA